MNPIDLVRSRDGSMSLTKLAAATFHAQLAAFVCWITYKSQSFDQAMWLLYASFAVGHATYDKTMATLKSLKDPKAPAP
jgi:hypothetical protein